MYNEIKKQFTIALIGIFIFMGLVYVYKKYQVWGASQTGKAELARAEQNRKIKIFEAEAKVESARLEAQAEVERAKGVAEANRIIGKSLENNSNYLRYLYINNLAEIESKGGKVIYIPTEAGLPILEAGKR